MVTSPKQSKIDTRTGYFPAGESVLRMVNGSRIVGLLYGQRALLIGSTDPRNYIGSNEHTQNKDLPYRRLARTAEAFEVVYFGSRQQADALLAQIARMHAGVKGKLKQDVGIYTKGTSYSAFDPDMMLWTLASIADSAEVLFEILVRKLSPGEKEQLWQDYILMGELFGLPRADMPKNYQQFREYFENRLLGHELVLTHSARKVGKQICFEVPVPLLALPLRWAMNLVVLGSLPPKIRRMYRLRYGVIKRVGYKLIKLSLRLSYKLVPSALKTGYDDFFYGTVMRTESKLYKKGLGLQLPDDPYGK